MKGLLVVIAILVVAVFIHGFVTGAGAGPCDEHDGYGFAQTSTFYGITFTDKFCADGFIYERSNS